MLEAHRKHPFHAIESWKAGHYFEATSLSQQGYIFHLHAGNQSCTCDPSNLLVIENFVIVDKTLIHTFNMETCACKGLTAADQLIAASLFPATFKAPRSAFTFAALDYYLLDNTICHTTAYSFCEKLKHGTDPLLASQKVPVSIYIRGYTFNLNSCRIDIGSS